MHESLVMRTLWRTASLTIAAWLLPTWALAQAAPSVGLVIDVRGAVSRQTNQAQQALEALTYVAKGERLTLAPGASLVLTLHAGGRKLTLAGPAEVVVEADKLRSLSGNAARMDTLSAAQSGALTSDGSRLARAAVSMKQAGASWLITQPDDGELILGNTVQVHWRGEPATVSVSTNGNPVARYENAQSPVEFADLRAGQSYQITVGDRARTVRVADAARTKHLMALQPAKPGFDDTVIYAVALEQAGARSAARAVWRQLAAERPDSAVLQRYAGE